MIVEPSLKLLMCEEKATNTEMHKSLFFLSFLQVMFEKYQFDSVHIAIQAVLTLYAQGKRVHSRKIILAVYPGLAVVLLNMPDIV